MRRLRIGTLMKKRVGILISGRGSNMMALLEAARAPDFPAEIAVVISNRPAAPGLERAHAAGVKALAIDHKGYATREAFDDAVEAALIAQGVELICHAGFMRIQSEAYTARWLGRQLNIHPSLLPAFKGLHPHKQALDAGVRISGCTVHFVTPELELGPDHCPGGGAGAGRGHTRHPRRSYPRGGAPTLPSRPGPGGFGGCIPEGRPRAPAGRV